MSGKRFFVSLAVTFAATVILNAVLNVALMERSLQSAGLVSPEGAGSVGWNTMQSSESRQGAN